MPRNPFQKPQHFFPAPARAARQITAGFSFLQRIGKSANIDVWFPDALKCELDARLEAGEELNPSHFPAEWAAVRQFELLQDGGNYKIYDLKTEHLWRTMSDLAQHMRAGGYRVTVVTIGGYAEDGAEDELAILDKHLQERISCLINMLYLEEQSADISGAFHETLRRQQWDYQTALPHVGVTLGARQLFRPDGRGEAARRHRLARHFFDILSLLPQKHILHDVAVGLQLPDLTSEGQWVYIAPDGEKLHDFNLLMSNIFTPFDKFSLHGLHGREGRKNEAKATVQHLRGHGDRLTPGSDEFLRGLARALHEGMGCGLN